MEPFRLAIAATMIATACLSIEAQEDNKNLPAENYHNKIADMQKSIASLREEITRIRTERNDLQVKIEQSDQAIASHLQKIAAIQNSVAENSKKIEALENEKKS